VINDLPRPWLALLGSAGANRIDDNLDCTAIVGFLSFARPSVLIR
jgi:hypothetical protein